MMPSIFSASNPILFGVGTSKEVGKRAKGFGCTKVLLVFGKNIEAAGLPDKIEKYLREEDIEVVRYNGVQADPPDWSAEEAARIGLENKVDGIIGLGGGSSLDTAKAATLLQTNPFPLRQYFGRFAAKANPGITLIVIPTTAGSGSECTPGGVITDTENQVKTNVNGAGCKVTLGICDPELTLRLPKPVTASTGFDALCHAMESYTSIGHNPFAALAAEKAITLVGNSLMRAYTNGSYDLKARIDMMEAATLGGISMMGPLCHLGHDIGRALGASYRLPHGIACVISMPQVLAYIASAVPEKVAFIGRALGADIAEGEDSASIGVKSKEALRDMMKAMNIPTLQSYGLNKLELFEKIPPNVLEMGLALAPMPTTTESIISILDKVYEENVW